ncbi:hypothetical protein ABAZ39_05360 [Azospirillum argentinense]|uniref:Uncharacterized protein n=1 Tax=Azospirillum argentinense TaxID=2970906 RepID=A0A2K1G795_9PROT|nr:MULTISPECIES: hypothetical protein [Azospirillum]AIB11450.1 hypothetical protein ABAZ39_05360 [Azospirillum argentinense]EZQ09735.1 hypothetical protein ABAZ39_06800 [Azospirillum argentinense]KAA1058765.1 hypothetical protein FH063_000965 [Azospirillum argentinense]MBK3798410.1 hypothetical protein [Azospirillum argentinense]PNR00662.1 hypothetical protein C1S70_00655 [Azospirillum argentinense]
MSRRNRHAHDAKCRTLLQATADRLDRLRSQVERFGLEGHEGMSRDELERTLDALRGQHNRLSARVEAARIATDDAWTFARAIADQAAAELADGLDGMEARLKRVAA